MSGGPQYQGSQVQGSYIAPQGPLDVTGPGMEQANIAKSFLQVFKAAGDTYQKYRNVHRRTTLNDEQVAYNNLLKQGDDRFTKEISKVPTEQLKPENLEATINKYIKPYNEYIDESKKFEDDDELKSRASVIFQAKFFQAQGKLLETAEKELQNRHLKHIYRHSESVSSEVNLKSPEKAKEAINLFRNNTLKDAIDDGVLKPWQADAEVKKMWKQYNTVQFHSDYQIAQQEDKLSEFIKRVNDGYYDTEYQLFDGTKETVGLDWNRIRGVYSQIATAVQGMATLEQKRFQTNLLKNEIEQDPEKFLNTFATKKGKNWDITKSNAQAFTERDFQYEIKPSEQLSLLHLAKRQYDTENKKNEGAVPITADRKEALFTQYAHFHADEALENNAGNYDPTKDFILTEDEDHFVVAQIRNFGKLIGQQKERIEDASLDDIQEMENQINEHLDRTTDVGSKKYKKIIREKFSPQIQQRKTNLIKHPASTALRDIIDIKSPEGQAIFEGKAPLPVDDLLERQKELKIVTKDATTPKIPEHLVELYDSRHNHENVSKDTVDELNTLISMHWGASSEDIKRNYLQQLRNSSKGNDSEFGAYWELYPTLEPYGSAAIAEALRTKKEAFEGLPGVGDDIQEYISDRNTLLNVFNESNQIGAYRKLFKFLAQTEMLDSKIAPGDDWERKKIVKGAGNMLTKGWVAAKSPDLGSTLVARKPMFSRIVASDDLHEHLQHGILVGKLGLNPANIEFPEYTFPAGTTDKQMSIFKRDALSGELEDGPLGGIGITAVNHPKNADMWMYALVLKKHTSDAPQILSPVLYNGKPLVYDSATVRNDLIPAMHRLQFLEELFTVRTPFDVVPTNTYSVQELKEILNKGLPANAPPSKGIYSFLGVKQKWNIEDLGELEYEFLGEILEVAQDYAGEGNEISDYHLSQSLYFWNDKLGGFNARWAKTFDKAFATGDLPEGYKRTLPGAAKYTKKRYYGELFE